jgi:hypothetical protein
MSDLGWLEGTVCCSVSIHSWGNAKNVKAADVSQYSGELAEQAAKRRVSMTKRLLECAEYQAIKSRDGHAGKWFAEHSVPSLFRHGVYAVPLAMMNQWTEYLEEYQDARRILVGAFGHTYYTARWQAEAELGPLYRSEDYPDAETVASKFSVEIRYLELGVPGKLALIAPEAFAKAQAELTATVEQGKAHIESILCQEATELVQGLHGALQGLDDGTLKRFYDSHVEKIVEWSSLFLDARNVTGFTELADVAEQLKTVALGYDTGALKKFGFLRKEVKAELDGALITLKGLMEARPARKLDLD